jgi:hypothetical protein
MPFPGFLLGGNSSLASLCGLQGRSLIAQREPAEPDDPNSSTLNPTRQEKLGVGKSDKTLDKVSILGCKIQFRIKHRKGGVR